MKVKLDGIDRLVMENILAKKGNLLTQTTKKEILEKTSIKTEEFDIYGLREVNNQIVWNSKKIKIEKEFEFNKEQVNLMKSNIKRLDDANEIEDTILNLCLKINELKI